MSAALAATPQRPRPVPGLVAFLVASQLLMLASLVPWVAVARRLLAIFDSGSPPPSVMLPLAIAWTYPLWMAACAVLAWRAFRAGRYARAVRLSCVPLVPALALLTYLGWSSGPAPAAP